MKLVDLRGPFWMLEDSSPAQERMYLGGNSTASAWVFCVHVMRFLLYVACLGLGAFVTMFLMTVLLDADMLCACSQLHMSSIVCYDPA